MRRGRALPIAALAAIFACTSAPASKDAGPPDAGPSPDSGFPVDAGPDAGAGRDAGGDAGPDAGPPDSGPTPPYTDAGVGPFCTLPGAVIYTDAGQTIVPGASGQPSFAWLTLPVGFCVHHYATVANARQLRFAPGGELFVSSPSTHTVSGGLFGLGAIAVVPDDNHDGLGDSILTFKAPLPSTVGMLFANGSFFHQEGTQIVSQPYSSGQRIDNGMDALVTDITVYKSSVHWPKTLDVSDTGSVYVGNGGDEPEACLQPMPFQGGVLELDGTDGGRQVVMGLRNPIAVKCHHDGNDVCFALELGMDGSDIGREKLLPLHAGDDWGYPCCASTSLAYSGVTVPCASNPAQQCPPDCSGVVPDTNSFLIGNTPFGLDFVDDQFPPPWSHKVIVALHGHFESWSGARLVAIDIDPTTGLLLPSSTMDGGDVGHVSDFAIGWDDGTLSHGRPTDVEMSPDGRLFVANDQNGEIFWIAPNVP
jgi:glucose/arabinose dehydrogenase